MNRRRGRGVSGGVGRLVRVLALAAVVLGTAAPAALAHEGGKAEARIAARAVPGVDLKSDVVVRLTDADSGDPIPGAAVTVYADMTRPHRMHTDRVQLRERKAGTYSATLQFLMPGRWTIHIDAGGPDVVGATAELPTKVELVESGSPEATSPPSDGGAADVRVLPTRVDDVVTRDDALRMLSLWLHSLAALGWIVGVLVMAVALSTRPGILADTARARLARAYASWGAWVHWSLVLVIVATGVYQMLYVSPFPLAYTPDEFSRLASIPYGLLYESILISKLALFGVLLVTGTMTLLRLVEPPLPVVPVTNPHPGGLRILASALGPPGIAYLATVPLILGAAMALRYVHILSHVAEVIRTGAP